MASNDEYHDISFEKLASKRKDLRINSILESHVYKNYNNVEHAEAWRNMAEIPTQEEIMPRTKDSLPAAWNEYQYDSPFDPSLPRNIVDGPWGSTDAYLEAQYKILRKDAVFSLQTSVEAFKRNQITLDDRESYVYTDLTVKGILATTQGLAFRVEFSVDKSSKRVNWSQSKRLTPGSIVALSPEKDGFKTVCKVAVVAARPLDGLIQNPPSIELFFAENNDIEIDPMQKLIMIEARSGFFESKRYMLVAIQKLMTERFHLANHIVAIDKEIIAPPYLQEHPFMDLSVLQKSKNIVESASEPQSHSPSEDDLQNVNVLKSFPAIPESGMDSSQLKACEMMLTKRVAVVQGPPGTGKTHVSVTALKALIASSGPTDPPIIVAAQTNHALDQLLGHIQGFEKNIVRLGSRCDKNNAAIKERTLYELRVNNPKLKGFSRQGARIGIIRRETNVLIDNIKSTLLPLMNGKILTSDILMKHGIISEFQKSSLTEEGWENDSGEGDIQTWLQDLVPIPETPITNMGLEMEEVEEEDLEQTEDFGLETPENADSQEAMEGLPGEWLPFGRKYTGRTTPISPQKLKKLLAKRNLYDIPRQYRGTVYRMWEDQINQKMSKELKVHAHAYTVLINRRKIAKDFANINLIHTLNTRVIGATTTGLGKYRGLLSALEPRVLVIEEAAETLEGAIIAGMFDSLQQLILVGDHNQLQAKCSVPQLGVEPYNLNISMFERLVNNGLPFVMLNRQRRMSPEIRALLTIQEPGQPFYKDLFDHPSVLDRSPVPGMGERSMFWTSHNWPETRNMDGSWLNVDEAEMVALFYNYLVLNGHDQEKITILTFYQGQRKELLRQLRRIPNIAGRRCKVHTVDSYQGEENDIIILSLVRCNTRMGIGFLDNRNRLVVALSRARRGLYFFGSSVTLRCGEHLDTDDIFEHSSVRQPLWTPILEQLRREGHFSLNDGLLITCQNHGKLSHIHEPGDWIGNAGGCKVKCKGRLPCGHECPHNCHPFAHANVICPAPCQKQIPTCGHPCGRTCGERCFCALCISEEPLMEVNYTLDNHWAFDGLQSSVDDWRNFDVELADHATQKVDTAASASISQAPQDRSRRTLHEVWKETKVDTDGKRGRVVVQHHSIHHDQPSTKSPVGGQVKDLAERIMNITNDDLIATLNSSQTCTEHSCVPASGALADSNELSNVLTSLPDLALSDLISITSNDSNQSEDLIEL